MLRLACLAAALEAVGHRVVAGGSLRVAEAARPGAGLGARHGAALIVEPIGVLQPQMIAIAEYRI